MRGLRMRPILSLISTLCLTTQVWSWNPDYRQQYHIQTDEGPERYFRYQTSNGQYRKEKRLADGTVVGTEGWLDPLGYLRIKDYIADDAGYRILKSKVLFVGKDRPIQEAVSSAARTPASSGASSPPNPFRQPPVGDLPGNGIEPSYDRTYVPPKAYESTSNRRRLPSVRFEPPIYDGNYRTPTGGFRYYLNRHYHEEEPERREDADVGSFGYVDPFGIRRVIYYKADPRRGFLHRKNNKFVGLHGTPYDLSPTI